MKLFNNPEIKKFCAFFAGVTVLFSFVLYFISADTVPLFLIFAITCFIGFLVFTKNRYKKIENITDAIEEILQGKEKLSIGEFKEGELSVLETQVEKMFIRLAEQKDILKKEKTFLADSIADISHQIRTPLTSINLTLSLLSESEITDDRRELLLMELTSLIGRTENLVTTLLKISKIDAGSIRFLSQRIDIDELIRKAAEPLMISMDIKNITLHKKCENLTLQGDMLWLTEAVSNILKNSVEHTPENGHVEILAADNPLYTEIMITDSGCGFSEDDLPHIFERFYKGKNTTKESFGIGLNLAKTIIQNQNGIIKAENVPEGGARFTIRIYKTVI
ncbi:MAG: HAMP domain-containing histidine kinase [Ruminococcaceae bacterium]|nr:HAMP domain-containing histidine kinase [Oscillospiraceae bacterium]MBR3597686.1 HAMP domain-containing histidine kinase [Clostridia bacterium]